MKTKRNFNNRKHKVKTVNIFYYQEEIIKRKNLDFSKLTRQLLDEFLKNEFPDLFEEIKKDEEGEENEIVIEFIDF